MKELRETDWGIALQRFVHSFPALGFQVTMMDRRGEGSLPTDTTEKFLDAVKDELIDAGFKIERVSGDDPERVLDEIFEKIATRLRRSGQRKIFCSVISVAPEFYTEGKGVQISIMFYPQPIVEQN